MHADERRTRLWLIVLRRKTVTVVQCVLMLLVALVSRDKGIRR